MARPQAPDPTEATDVPDEDAWTPPGMSPLRKIALTLLMVVLGVVPGLMLLASDPLGNSSGETALGDGGTATDDPPEAVDAGIEPPDEGTVASDDGGAPDAPPAAPTPPPPETPAPPASDPVSPAPSFPPEPAAPVPEPSPTPDDAGTIPDQPRPQEPPAGEQTPGATHGGPRHRHRLVSIRLAD
ncbi:MAG TPA: hypothetical protein VM327_01610 [Candidatus Thermoplasmatota archaeon]|nr:hypothetical protein [Candidatus Thermoplasmatota archaeon]